MLVKDGQALVIRLWTAVVVVMCFTLVLNSPTFSEDQK